MLVHTVDKSIYREKEEEGCFELMIFAPARLAPSQFLRKELRRRLGHVARAKIISSKLGKGKKYKYDTASNKSSVQK